MQRSTATTVFRRDAGFHTFIQIAEEAHQIENTVGQFGMLICAGEHRSLKDNCSFFASINQLEMHHNIKSRARLQNLHTLIHVGNVFSAHKFLEVRNDISVDCSAVVPSRPLRWCST